MPVFAEGRVENQKLNQTAALLSFGWVFGFQLDLLEKNLVSLVGFTFSQEVSYQKDIGQQQGDFGIIQQNHGAPYIFQQVK